MKKLLLTVSAEAGGGSALVFELSDKPTNGSSGITTVIDESVPEERVDAVLDKVEDLIGDHFENSVPAKIVEGAGVGKRLKYIVPSSMEQYMDGFASVFKTMYNCPQVKV